MFHCILWGLLPLNTAAIFKFLPSIDTTYISISLSMYHRIKHYETLDGKEQNILVNTGL